jgi:hypothetical protein
MPRATDLLKGIVTILTSSTAVSISSNPGEAGEVGEAEVVIDTIRPTSQTKCLFGEFHLLGYKTPVRTSQETHYFSTTETNQLMLCKI